jgi:hypothetical protein
MKFFTPELYLEINSSDLDRVEKAHEKWEDAIHRYQEHVATISPCLAANARELARSLSLHDATFLTLMFVPLGNDRLAISRLRQDSSEILLLYLLEKDPLIEERKDWPFKADAAIYWLYDEFDVRPDGCGQHQVFLSDGRTLTFVFREMWQHTTESAQLGPNRLGSPAGPRSLVRSGKQSRRRHSGG